MTLLVQPGDTVVMEEPVHRICPARWSWPARRSSPCRWIRTGCAWTCLKKLILHKHPRFIFVNSSFHDPTGHILSLERRKKIIEISNTYRVPIVEEDAASELVYEGEKLPPIKAFDTLENVIYIYSLLADLCHGPEHRGRRGERRRHPQPELSGLRAPDGVGLDDAEAAGPLSRRRHLL